MYKVVFYTFSDRKSPIKEFLDACHPGLRSKIVRKLLYLEEYGLHPAIPQIRKLTGTHLWEMRILGKDNVRIVCVALPGNVIEVLHIFKKKKQKTPVKDLEIAINRSKEVLAI